MAKQKKSLSDKVQENYPDFATEVAGMSVEQLNSRLAGIAKELGENERTKENDEELEKAKDLASELGATYREIRKAGQLKSRYIVGLLREKGAV